MVRERDHIQGDGCEECLTVAFCEGCAFSQMLRQLDLDNGAYQLCTPTGDNSAAAVAP